MGQLKVITVTGIVPHVACEFDFSNNLAYRDGWLGFAPAKHRSPGWPTGTPGKIFTDDESYRQNHWVTFDLPDATLIYSYDESVKKYTGVDYILGVRDCVSFAADVAWFCGLKVPYVNMTPYGLVKVLGWYNNPTGRG